MDTANAEYSSSMRGVWGTATVLAGVQLSNFEEFAKLKFAALKSRSVVSSLASFCVIDLFAQGF